MRKFAFIGAGSFGFTRKLVRDILSFPSFRDAISGSVLGWTLAREEKWEEKIEEWLADPEVDLERGHEYAAYICNAVFGDNEPFTFNGNVRNKGFIDNLPPGSCVEVPVRASKDGLQPIRVGPLPAHLAILTGVNAQCEELAVQAALEGDPRKVFHAICMDPLTSAVLSLREIQDMTDEMLAQNRDFLPLFKSVR